MKKIFTITFCLMLAACGRDLGANNVVSTDEAGIVTQGTILSARVVTIKENDKLEKNGLGVIGGGVVGGIAGNGVGNGTGQNLATAGGAIAGAVLGAYIQDELSSDQGYEYIVKLVSEQDKRYADLRIEKELVENRDNIKNKLKKTINTPDTETNLISVVQGNDVVLTAGQKVFVIYSNDRIRLVPNI